MSCCVLGIVYFETVNFRFLIFIIKISESVVTYSCYTCRNCNRFKRCTVMECLKTDICHTVGYSDACERTAVPKCIICDAGDLFAVYFGRNFIYRIIADISLYFYSVVIKYIEIKITFIGKAVCSGIQMSMCVLGIVYREAVDLIYINSAIIAIISEGVIIYRCYTCRNSNCFE